MVHSPVIKATTFTVLRKQGTQLETAHLRRIINELIGLHEDVMVIV